MFPIPTELVRCIPLYFLYLKFSQVTAVVSSHGTHPSQETASEECALSALRGSIIFVAFLRFDVIEIFTGEGTTKVLYASSGDGTL